MADTLNRQSPLQDFASRFAGLTDSVRISEEPFVTMVDLWVEPTGAGGAAAATALGVGALPSAPKAIAL